MAASAQDIREWLARLYDDPKVTHMIVVCDTFSYDDYPVYVTEDQDVREREGDFLNASMQQVMEIYSRTYGLEEQMAERRAFHYD